MNRGRRADDIYLNQSEKYLIWKRNSSVRSILQRMKTWVQNSRKIKMCINKMADEVRKS